MSWSIKAFREKNLGLAALIPHDGARDNWTQFVCQECTFTVDWFIPLEYNNVSLIGRFSVQYCEMFLLVSSIWTRPT